MKIIRQPNGALHLDLTPGGKPKPVSDLHIEVLVMMLNDLRSELAALRADVARIQAAPQAPLAPIDLKPSRSSSRAPRT